MSIGIGNIFDALRYANHFDNIIKFLLKILSLTYEFFISGKKFKNQATNRPIIILYKVAIIRTVKKKLRRQIISKVFIRLLITYYSRNINLKIFERYVL